MKKEFMKFTINGIIATFIHYTVLNFNLTIIELESAGIANFIASFFGIITSFVGNKYYVFKTDKKNKFCNIQFIQLLFYIVKHTYKKVIKM